MAFNRSTWLDAQLQEADFQLGAATLKNFYQEILVDCGIIEQPEMRTFNQ